ncbi:hypothetical protein RUM44_007199 [Polyplax serrata]|uniref:MAM domain-containing protein n=1 Tax=Polyplax serrata TaxID=468196 RepID=A0ABR1B026_POLSC
MTEGTEEIHVWSPRFSQTKPQCKLHVDLKMINMTSGNFKVVIETTNDTSWVVDEKMGNDRNVWEKFIFIISRIQQRFRIILEVSPSRLNPSQLSMDNIKLVDCFPERPTFKTCSTDLFRCSKEGNDFCINKTQICDIEQDCLNGEDEKQGCVNGKFRTVSQKSKDCRKAVENFFRHVSDEAFCDS